MTSCKGDAILQHTYVNSRRGKDFLGVRPPRAVAQRQASKGFSLVEMIAALAIIAAASLALFQSIAFWMRLSAAATDAAGSAVSDSIDLERYQYLVRGLTYAWPEQTDDVFTGGPAGFGGLTRRPLHFADPGLERVTLRVVQTEGQSALTYSGGEIEWTVAIAPGGGSLSFSYLGLDGAWRSSWPPDATPMVSSIDNPALFRTPQLPLAIRLDYAGELPFAWIADVGDDPSPAGRTQDITGVSDDLDF